MTSRGHSHGDAHGCLPSLGLSIRSLSQSGANRYGHKIIDLGALIVYGHHPHVLQGIERYKKGLILYSLGNFFLPDFIKRMAWHSGSRENRGGPWRYLRCRFIWSQIVLDSPA